MKASARGVDDMNEAVTRGIRKAAKRTIPKGKGVAPPFWTMVATELEKEVWKCGERENAGGSDSLAEEGAWWHGAGSVEG
ncbi:hypothetical protein ERJ75_000496200 [Trypanosoma vivax]|nr:hypothetical protein ERJ75_000496200 [Trypanosoma vivax]